MSKDPIGDSLPRRSVSATTVLRSHESVGQGTSAFTSRCTTAGEVVESRHDRFAPGDQVVGMGGWQQYSVVDGHPAGGLRKVDTRHIALSHYLGAVGMPGMGWSTSSTPNRARPSP